MKHGLKWETLLRSKLFWAVVAELLILLVGFIIRPDFLNIQIRTLEDGTRVLFGTPIDILNRSSEITIIAMGMTLVLALGGTDISVGALVAVSGAIALKFLRWDVLVYTTPGDYTVMPFAYALLVPLAVCTLMGLFNGTLVARLKIQPIIATLILMVGGRGIAQIVTNGKQFTTQYTPFKHRQRKHPGIPLPIIITLVVVVAMLVFVRRTSRHVRGSSGHQSQRQPGVRIEVGDHHPHRLCHHRLSVGHLRADLRQPHLFQRLQQRGPGL